MTSCVCMAAVLESINVSLVIWSRGNKNDLLFVCPFSGPCAGKTTTLARLRTFFENLGWKVSEKGLQGCR